MSNCSQVLVFTFLVVGHLLGNSNYRRLPTDDVWGGTDFDRIRGLPMLCFILNGHIVS